MKMKSIKLFFLAGVTLLALGSCQKAENLGGQAIRFSATANPTTKTAYGDYDNAETPTSQAINWINGERVRIWSDAATLRYDPNVRWNDYVIANANGNRATLDNNPEIPNGLVYVDGVDEYQFWASCPPVASFNDAQAQYSISDSQKMPADSTVKDGIIPADMSQAVLLAQTTGPWKAYGNTDKSISLVFNPAFTAFEITLLGDMRLGNESITLKSVVLKGGDDKDLAATVTATFTSDDIQYSFGTSRSTLTYNFPGNGVTISESTKITFTVFAIPDEIPGLKLMFTLDDGQIRTATLTSNTADHPLVFDACMKHRLYGLAMPDGFKMFASEAELEVAEEKEKSHGIIDL